MLESFKVGGQSTLGKDMKNKLPKNLRVKVGSASFRFGEFSASIISSIRPSSPKSSFLRARPSRDGNSSAVSLCIRSTPLCNTGVIGFVLRSSSSKSTLSNPAACSKWTSSNSAI